MPRPRAAAAVLSAVALTAAASSAPAVAQPPPSATIEVGDMFFSPDETFVRVGATVEWTWTGVAPHNVTFADGPASPTQTDGTYTRTFDAVGEYGYVCTIHPDEMQGSVDVLAEDQPLPPQLPPPRPSPGAGRIEPAEDAVGAALRWSALFGEGDADQVLLARDDDPADALASGLLQGFLDAPLLLTPTAELDERVAAELERLGTSVVYVLGGDAAVSDEVVAELEASGLAVERISGASRAETAVAIATLFVPHADSVILARGFAPQGGDPTQAFADALGAGAAAARRNEPVLLTQTEALSDATRTYLAGSQVDEVTVVGGVGAVSQQVVDDLTALDLEVARVSGPNRFATAVELAAFAFAGGRPAETVILVEGQASNAWTGALTAASAAESAAIFLTSGDLVPQEDLALIVPAPPSQSVAVVCGPTVTETACDRATAASQAAPFPAPATKAAALAGDEEVPGPGDLQATGEAYVLPTPDPSTLCYEWNFYGTAPVVGAHIHRGASGESGPVVVPLATPLREGEGAISCAFDLDAALVGEILDTPGGFYVNLHTPDHPDGAVRGQLRSVSFAGIAELQGSEEVPGPGAQEGGGFSLFWTDADADGTLCYFLGYDLPEAATAAHLHRAPRGAAGPVVVPLQTPPGPVPAVAACLALEPAALDGILADLEAHYVNLHTPEFPDGALRGQLFNPFAAPTDAPPPGDAPPPADPARTS